jgi:hypothetical protein
MATDNERDAPASPRRQPFTFYAARDRIYVRNRDQKVIDLGALRKEGGEFSYLLDGNEMTAGKFGSEEAALKDVAGKVRFLWLDGQFTAVADARDDPALNLDGVPQFEVMLDELGPDERIYDATV